MKKISLVLLNLCWSAFSFAQKYTGYRYFDEESYDYSSGISDIGYLIIMGLVIVALGLLMLYGLIWHFLNKRKEKFTAIKDSAIDLFSRREYYFIDDAIGGKTLWHWIKGRRKMKQDRPDIKIYRGEKGYYNLNYGSFLIKRRGLFFYKIKGLPDIISNDPVTLIVSRREFKKCTQKTGNKFLTSKQLIKHNDYWSHIN